MFEQLHGLMHAIKAQMRDAVVADNDGFPPMAARALAFFARNPGSTPSDLVAHAGRDKAQIARIIKFLEDERYVARTPDPADRRSYSLALTERGRAIQKQMQAQRKRVLQTLLTGVSDAERAQLAALLARLRANLDS